jgi:hypothetical protein
LLPALVVALLTALAGACNNNAPQGAASRPAFTVSTSNATDARRLSEGANKLIEAMNRPESSFHFSFKGQEKIIDTNVPEKNQKPIVGPVTLEADVTPLDLDLKESRGGKVKQAQAKREDETSWNMAHLDILEVMTSPNLVIAVGSHVAEPPGNDIVGATMTDKYSFDTTTATGAQKKAFDLARLVLPSIQDCKGTAWIAKDSGELIKFTVDAAYSDRAGHAWTEHYEGVVVPR